MARQVMTRDQAHAAGAKRYYTGVRCVRGHDADRYVTNGACVDCMHRKAVAGPTIGAPNVKAVGNVSFSAFLPAPNADELFAVNAVFQGCADDVLALVRQLHEAGGLEYVQIARLATQSEDKFVRVAGMEPTRAQRPAPAVPFGHVAPARVDSVTGLAVPTSEDGAPTFRPNPFA